MSSSHLCSVADPGCVSRILIFTHPGSRIQKQQQKRGVKKKFCCHTFLCSLKFHKIENRFSFEVLKKKFLGNFQRITIELFTLKIITKRSKIWVLDPRSEIRDPEKTYSGSRIQGSKRHRIPDPDLQHCIYVFPLFPSLLISKTEL
jgi:hypothetical protein